MYELLSVCLSVAAAIAVIAFLRERKLRLALQRLVHHLLSRWRTYGTKHDSDRDHHDRDRLSDG